MKVWILNGTLKIISLGGSGEVGKNMLAFHYEDTIVVVDAGVAFPTEEHPGVDLIIPDITLSARTPGDGEGDLPHARSRGPHRRAAVRPQSSFPCRSTARN